MNFKTFDEFLKAIGFPTNKIDCKPKLQPCELCGSTSFTSLRSFVDAGDNVNVPIRTVSCDRCGYLMQNPRPPEQFFEYYYNNYYSIRRSLSDKNKDIAYAESSGEVPYSSVENQIKRAENLCSYMESQGIDLNNYKRIFDIGCGGGGFLAYFRERGFDVDGSDPDLQGVKAAKKFFDIKVSSAMSENFDYRGKYDIFLIMGSLEHCVDPNKVLDSIAKASKPGTLIIHEGRSFPISYSYKFLNFNHHRYLLRPLTSALLEKHGFKTILSTDQQICGSGLGRDGNGYVIASFDPNCSIRSEEELHCMMKNKNYLVDSKRYKDFLDKHDKKISA